MTTPEGPRYGDQASDRPAWGQQPAGGWGQQHPDPTWAWDRPGALPWDERATQQPAAPQQRGGQAGGPPAWGRQRPGQEPQQWQQPPWGSPPSGQGRQEWGRQEWGRQEWGRQPGQQHGQSPGPQWGHDYPALPEPTRDDAPGRLPLVGGGVVVVLGLVALLGFVTPGFFVTRVFDAQAMQDGVSRVLTEEYGITGLGPVTCGEGIEVAEGATFDCAITVDGAPARVPIRVTSDGGDYEVGRPA
jgi:hypothetical protein